MVVDVVAIVVLHVEHGCVLPLDSSDFNVTTAVHLEEMWSSVPGVLSHILALPPEVALSVNYTVTPDKDILDVVHGEEVNKVLITVARSARLQREEFEVLRAEERSIDRESKVVNVTAIDVERRERIASGNQHFSVERVFVCSSKGGLDGVGVVLFGDGVLEVGDSPVVENVVHSICSAGHRKDTEHFLKAVHKSIYSNVYCGNCDY